jgi:hypothetical protein
MTSTLLFVSLTLVAGDTAEPATRILLRPMAAPEPALRYQLLPEVRELSPGNPAQYYLRCFAEQRGFFFNKEANAERARYLSMPLAQLADEKLTGYGGFALTQADWAARLDSLDWLVLQRVQNEGLALVLPEIGPLQVLCAGLQTRLRIEAAGRRYDDAVRSAKTMFALARHLGEHPTLAANLLGLSLAQRTLDTLEEMIQQPGCPNLYWALADLPSPLVDLHKGFQGQRAMVAAELRLIRDDATMTEAQIEELISHLSGQLGFVRERVGEAPQSLRARLEARLRDTARVQAARKRLVAAGAPWMVLYWKSSPAQVILLDEKRDFDIRWDERVKCLTLAPWQIDSLAAVVSRKGNGDGLFSDLLPAVIPNRRNQARVEQRIGLLRHIEALRLYAAGHSGKLPDQLADLSVPLPSDPFSGQPFVYQRCGTRAELHGSPPRDEEKLPGYVARYLILLP